MKQVQLRAAAVLVLLGALLNGCDIARDHMEASKAEYKACLEQNPQTPANCEIAAIVYGEDVRVYEANSAGIL